MLENMFDIAGFYKLIAELSDSDVETVVKELRSLRLVEFPVESPGCYKLDGILAGYSPVMAGLVFSNKTLALLLDNAFNKEMRFRRHSREAV
jgi:hypothetical protein